MSRSITVIRSITAFLDKVSYWTARLACLITLLIMAALVREIVGRYFFNAPSLWVNEINQYLLCVLTMMGGAYCVFTDAHIRVDILWRRFSLKTQSVVELLTAVFPIVFLGIITWLGFVDSWEAIVKDKRSMSILAMPLWPSILAVPLGTGLMLLQFIARLARDILQLVTGKSEHPQTAELID